MTRDEVRLDKAIRAVGAVGHQVVMAVLLLRVNRLDNALEFVYGLQQRGLTRGAAPAKQSELTTEVDMEHKSVWITNSDEAIRKRVAWMQQRGWELVGSRVFSGNPAQISMTFRRPSRSTKQQRRPITA